MIRGHRHRRVSERDLVALADGSLPVSRRAQTERAIAASPELQADVCAQRRALAAVRGVANESAPAGLRAGLTSTRQQPGRRRAPRLAVGAAAAATAAAIAVVLALVSGSAAGPTVAQATVLAIRPAQGPTGAPRGEAAILPRVRAAGLPFPYWADRFGFGAAGVRRDRLDGRLTTTVFYTRAGERIAYTIVSGAPLAAGRATLTTTRAGTRLQSLGVHGRTVVTWLRRGHTCVLSATSVPRVVLLRLAAWRGAGQIPY
ncbi:MAG: hypothetical protein JOZ07_16220 [Solirubrobacterales bacterium]|nr:hypothetical protein [Solirubrobacterales bacterium]